MTSALLPAAWFDEDLVTPRVPSAPTTTAADTVTVSDGAVPAVSRARGATDSWAVSDTAPRVISSARGATDGVTVSDAATPTVSLGRGAADTVTLSDAAGPVFSYPSVVLATPGLMSYWRLGEASGNALDSKGSSPGTTVTAGITRAVTGLITGDTDKAAQSNGAVGSYIRVPSAGLDTTTAITVELWVKLASVTASLKLLARTSSSTVWFIEIATLSSYRWYVRDANLVDTILANPAGPAPAAGVRHHIVGTYDAAGFMKLYINGVSVVNNPNRTPNANMRTGTSQDLFMFAASDTLTGISGVLDEVALYNVAFTPQQALDHYNAGAGGGTAPLIRTASDTVAVSDVTGRTGTRPRPVADSLSVSDLAGGTITVTAPASDLVPTSDVAARAAFTRTRAATDSVTVGPDIATPTVGRVRPVVDTVIVSGDTASRAATTKARTAVDAWTATDVAAGVKVILRTAVDAWTLTDAALRSAAPRVRPVTDTVVISDLAVRSPGARVRGAVDSVATSDIAAGVKVGGIFTTAVDSVVMADTALRAPATRVRTAVDPVSVTDVAGRSVTRPRSAADALVISDAVLRLLVSFRTAADLLVVLDTAQRAFGVRLGTTDTITVADLAEGVLGHPVVTQWLAVKLSALAAGVELAAAAYASMHPHDEPYTSISLTARRY